SRRKARRAAFAARFAAVPFSEFSASFPPFPPTSFLDRKLFRGGMRRVVQFRIFPIVGPPGRAVRIFVIPGARAASTHLILPYSARNRVNCVLRFALSSTPLP